MRAVTPARARTSRAQGQWPMTPNGSARRSREGARAAFSRSRVLTYNRARPFLL